MRALLAVGIALALAALPACGDDADGGDGVPGAPAAEPPRLQRLNVGEGERAATILRPADAPPGRPVVIFLHGWTAIQPERYGPWLRHLAGRGATVIYPVYQRSPFFDVSTPLTNAVAGVRAALERLDGQVGPVVVAGHSAGGALAADVAAVASQSALPTPRAVFAVYPGRGLRGIPLRLATPDASGIDPETRILALAGERDTVVGDEAARSIVATATQVPEERRTLRVVTDPAAADHQAPHRDGPAEREAFWAPLDALVDEAAAGA